MQALFTEFRIFLTDFCPAARKFFRFGMPTVCGLFLSAFVNRLLLGVVGNYDKMLRVTQELLLCGKELFGAVLFSVLILQLLHMAYVWDYGKPPQK
ncbi:MAG: hypothetical protein ACI4LB_07175 [Candidatus Fimenecus sp.]